MIYQHYIARRQLMNYLLFQSILIQRKDMMPIHKQVCGMIAIYVSALVYTPANQQNILSSSAGVEI